MAGEIDPVRVVDDAIEDGVCVGGIADQLVPFVNGDLAGDDRRSAAIALFENLEEIVTRSGIERLEAPVVEDEQLHVAERPLDAGISTVAAGEREIGEQLGECVGRGRSDCRDMLCGRALRRANSCRRRLARTGSSSRTHRSSRLR